MAKRRLHTGLWMRAYVSPSTGTLYRIVRFVPTGHAQLIALKPHTPGKYVKLQTLNRWPSFWIRP